MDEKTYTQDLCISTVSLKVPFGNHLYETMVFPAKDGKISRYLDMYCERYETEDEALRGHLRVIEEVKNKTIEFYDDGEWHDEWEEESPDG